MSSTRTAAEGSALKPERYLSNPKITGLQIGLNIVCRAARNRTLAERRALIWLTNYSLHRNITADTLSDELDLPREEINQALTNPEHELGHFCRKVALLRAAFEKTLPVMVDTHVDREARLSLRFAAEKRKLVEFIGKTRMGKSECARPEFLRKYMDRGVWVTCPASDGVRDFVFTLARAMGIGVGSGKKASQLGPQIAGCFGPGMLELLVVDEAHFLWPADLRAKPIRIEFLRVSIHNDGATGVMVIASPQHIDSLNAALGGHDRWAPGQWDGRVNRFHCKDTMGEAELEAVALHHCPEATPSMLNRLVKHAMATSGFCGAMVNAIDRARFMNSGGKVTEANLIAAQQQMVRGSELERRAAEIARGTGRRAA